MDNANTRNIYSDNKYNDVWNSHKHALKAKKMDNPPLKLIIEKLVGNQPLNLNIEKKKKRAELPERLTSPVAMMKYFVLRSNIHGIRYFIDDQLFQIERLIWFIGVTMAFIFSIQIIFTLYSEYQAQRSHIIIDNINELIFSIPFPSVTICPSSRVDWDMATKLTKKLIPPDNVDATRVLQLLLRNMGTFNLFRLQKYKLEANESTTEILRHLNLTEILLEVLPTCEKVIFECYWKNQPMNCCSIFDIQKTYFGFCYSFNSLKSINNKLVEPLSAHTFGMHSGLSFKARSDTFQHPPHSNKNTSILMISSHQVTPLKGQYLAYGTRYNVDLKFTSAFPGKYVLDAEKDKNAPCLSDDKKYKYESCLIHCQMMYVHEVCGCNPTFLYDCSDKIRDCNIEDLRCLQNISSSILDLFFLLTRDPPNSTWSKCICPVECYKNNYDSFVLGIPYKSNETLYIDIHFDGPTGVRYKRKIKVTNLDMLVQFGGIFGFFLGGSVLSFVDIYYCFIVSMLASIYRFIFQRARKDDVNNQSIVHVQPRKR